MSTDEAIDGWLESVDVDRIVPALPFLPVIGETVLSPGDGILTKVKRVVRVLDTDRYVVTGQAIGRRRTAHKAQGRQYSDATAWMFRLVPSAMPAARQSAASVDG